MKQKKLRGNNRILKSIEKWKKASLALNLEELNLHKREYVKIWVSPWKNLSIVNSEFPEPTRKHRIEILNALIEIYFHWEGQLKKLNQPFYLKIWFFDPRIGKSQVVCAIGDRMDYYQKLFHASDKKINFPKEKLEKNYDGRKLNWELFLDEDTFDETDFPERERYDSDESFNSDQRLLEKLKSGKYKSEMKESGNEKYNVYYIPRGNVWLGGQK